MATIRDRYVRARGRLTRASGHADPERENYPSEVAVEAYNRPVVDFLRTTSCTMIAEIGVYRGHTSREFAAFLDGGGELHLFDFDRTAQAVASDLRELGHQNVRVHGNGYRHLDSYNWSLAKMLRDHPEPCFDFVFIDGAHTWAIDGFATLLVDRLLVPGGFLAHDDYAWTLSESPSLRPDVFPLTQELYSDEQIGAQQVKMICDLLIRRDDRYHEVVENTVWQKRS